MNPSDEQYDAVMDDLKFVVTQYIDNICWPAIKEMDYLYDKYPELTSDEWNETIDWIVSGIWV